MPDHGPYDEKSVEAATMSAQHHKLAFDDLTQFPTSGILENDARDFGGLFHG
jgi:hypothetical protein